MMLVLSQNHEGTKHLMLQHQFEQPFGVMQWLTMQAVVVETEMMWSKCSDGVHADLEIRCHYWRDRVMWREIEMWVLIM